MSDKHSINPQLTQLLNQVNSLGDPQAPARLFDYLYTELKVIAKRQLKSEKIDLQATGLVHEAFLNLFGDQPMTWENRRHFFGAAARAMRQILIQAARSRQAQKRGGDRWRVTFSDGLISEKNEADINDILDLEAAIVALEQEAPELGQIVELRFFTGQTMETIAELQGTSLSTIERRWRLARAFLIDHLEENRLD